MLHVCKWVDFQVRKWVNYPGVQVNLFLGAQVSAVPVLNKVNFSILGRFALFHFWNLFNYNSTKVKTNKEYWKHILGICSNVFDAIASAVLLCTQHYKSHWLLIVKVVLLSQWKKHWESFELFWIALLFREVSERKSSHLGGDCRADWLDVSCRRVCTRIRIHSNTSMTSPPLTPPICYLAVQRYCRMRLSCRSMSQSQVTQRVGLQATAMAVPCPTTFL